MLICAATPRPREIFGEILFTTILSNNVILWNKLKHPIIHMSQKTKYAISKSFLLRHSHCFTTIVFNQNIYLR